MEPLDLDLAALAGNLILHKRPGRVADQHPTRLPLGLDTRRQVRLIANRRVGGSALGAEVTDARHPRVDPDPDAEGHLDAFREPLFPQLGAAGVMGSYPLVSEGGSDSKSVIRIETETVSSAC